MLTVIILLVVVAFIICIASAFSPPKAPLWVAVLLLCIVELIRILPLGK